MVKSHLTLLRLQLEQPARDLVWPFRGIGRLLVTIVEVLESAKEPGCADTADSEDCMEDVKQGDYLYLLVVKMYS